MAASLSVALLVAALFSGMLALARDAVQPLQLTAADMLFIREGGPMLGAGTVHPDIVLVLWDFKSVLEADGSGEAQP